MKKFNRSVACQYLWSHNKETTNVSHIANFSITKKYEQLYNWLIYCLDLRF